MRIYYINTNNGNRNIGETDVGQVMVHGRSLWDDSF